MCCHLTGSLARARGGHGRRKHEVMSKRKLSPQDTAALVAELLNDVPDGDLGATIAAVESSLMAAKERLKTLGEDPELEQLVCVAMSWVDEGLQGKAYDRDQTVDTVRRLLTHLKLKKSKSSFDEESSDMRGNTQGATFDIEFTLGPGSEHEGFVSGSAAETEGESYSGQLEMSFLPILEDDLLQHVAWDPRLRDCGVKDDVVLWMVAADIPESDVTPQGGCLDWRSACRAVAAAVFALAKESTHNDEPWVFEFLEKRVREELLLCPDRSF